MALQAQLISYCQCLPSEESVNQCQRCRRMRKNCKPRSVERHQLEISSSEAESTLETEVAPSTYHHNDSPIQAPERKRVPSRPEVIISELMKQLPSLPESEAFDLGRELNKQLKDWILRSRISSLKFRRTHLCDILSEARVTVLDYRCHAWESNDFSSLDGTVSVPQLSKQVQGVIVIAQRNSSGDQIPSVVHATSLYRSDSFNGPSTQERFDLSLHLQLCSGNRSDELRMALDAAFLEIYKGEWDDGTQPVNASCILPRSAKSTTASSGLSPKWAAVKRVCAWGAVSAWKKRDDYRFFSTCALGIFADLRSVYPREISEVEQYPSDFCIKAIPFLGVLNTVYGMFPSRLYLL